MNEKIKEILDGIKMYIGSIEDKIESGIPVEKWIKETLEIDKDYVNMIENNPEELNETFILPILQKVHTQLYDMDINIKPGQTEASVKAADENNVKEVLIEKGMKEEDFDVHESDLYVKKTPISEEFLKNYEFKNNVTEFKSEIEPKGEIWYDFPFANNKSFEDKDAKVESSVKNNVIELYAEYLNEFIDTIKEDAEKIEAKVIEEKFILSTQFNKFSNIVFATLTEALKDSKIKSNEYDEIIEGFGIKATDEEINKVIADEAIPPKPTDTLDPSDEYIWDPTSKAWIKQKKKV